MGVPSADAPPRAAAVEDRACGSTTLPMPSRLVALDLDGTLLDHDCTLPAGHARVVGELMRDGVQVALVTGRPLLTTRWVHTALRLTTPMVCFNGGWIGHPGKSPLATSLLDEAEVREVVAALADEGGTICCYPDADVWLIDRETPHTARWRQLYDTQITHAPERIHAWSGTSCKVMFVAEPERLAGAARRACERFAGRFHVVVSQNDRFEVSRAGVTKEWGLSRLAAHLGIAREHVWAVGDAANDAEMIAWAGHGCAMGNAPDAIRRVARHILPSITARGLCALPTLMARYGDA